MTYDIERPGALVPYSTPRLIPHVIDERAASIPEGEAFRRPCSSQAKDGWESVTWRRLANAINRTARWLVDTLGVPTPGSFPTIAYIAQNDARYIALVVATHKAGYKALLISPRNTTEAQLSLFEKTDCDTLLIDSALRPLAQQWLGARPSMQAIEIAPFAEWFTEEAAPHVPYTKTYDEAKWDPLVVLHTSGSTGIPKPVVPTHGMLGINDQLHDLPEYQGAKIFMRAFERRITKGIFVPMPLFHAAGLFFSLMCIAYWDIPYALGMPDRPVSADLAHDCIAHAGVDAVLLPPSVLEQMSQVPEHVEALSSLNMVVFGGGPLASETGDRLVQQGVKITNCIASSEACPYLFYFQPDQKLWQYYIFNSNVMNIEWRPDSDTCYQMVVRRRDKTARRNPGYQAWFYTFPDADEYDTKDLYAPHPTLPDHWRHVGRGDDIIVFSNGEKLNPVTVEDILTDHPAVHGALVVGAARFQAGLLVEPAAPVVPDHQVDSRSSTAEDEAEAAAQLLVDKIWPLVQRANGQTVKHGRIARDMIHVCRPGKPFLRAGKGTVQRAATVKLYSAEIDEMYRRAEAAAAAGPSGDVDIDTSSESALVKTLLHVFGDKIADSSVLASESKLGPDSDLFAVGVDSLMVVTASRQLRAGLLAAGYHPVSGVKDVLGPRAFYANPTPRLLARYILRCFVRDTEPANGTNPVDTDEEEQTTLKTMQTLLDQLTTDLPPPLHKNKPEPASHDQTIILTGSTGMLGGVILEVLLANPRVGRVVCLNRAADGGRSNNGVTDIIVDNNAARLEFHRIDSADPHLGLVPEVYDRLLRTADRIIHSAWPVNFNIPLSSFAASLQGVRGIADLASRAAKKVVVVFVSSIASVQGYHHHHGDGPVPETQLTDLRTALPSGGYGQSKMLGSLVLDEAAARGGGFVAASVRVGQIAGDHDAVVWNRHEWLPSLIASSVYLGALPRTLGAMDRVDWTPVERIAGLITEVAGIPAAGRAVVAGNEAQDGQVDDGPPGELGGYYHGINPQATTWSGALVQSVQEYYDILRLVDIGDWVTLLEESQKGLDDEADEAEVARKMARNPGLKLLDTYRGMLGAQGLAVLDMTRTQAQSPSMKAAGPVTPELMRGWCRQWGFERQ
ncbi:hypothetical protein Micbo1qcDRAFT_216469 [Microdochium bolleyi]|uniref:Polyketide synthase-like phosphopantetheine-binding domain-containing protein n=1 Tax=Microdochium bolleyi TaxID=196109 RepID=A0A136IR04_9PEZI|nr:hypothetical protein Micbo1qcDRAFT_216469 [Microdochium bolleyi]